MTDASDDATQHDAPADADARYATAAYEPAVPPPLRRPGTPAGAAPPLPSVPPTPPPRRVPRPLLAALVVLIAAAAGLAYLRPWEARTPGSLPRPGEGDTFERPRQDEALARPAPERELSAEAPEEGIYELSRVTQLPRPLNIPEVRRWMERNYPPQLRDARVTGTVQLRFVIGADGRVEGRTVTVTVSDVGFDAVAIRAVEQMRFSPAKVNGRPVRVWAELPIQFQVSG